MLVRSIFYDKLNSEIVVLTDQTVITDDLPTWMPDITCIYKDDVYVKGKRRLGGVKWDVIEHVVLKTPISSIGTGPTEVALEDSHGKFLYDSVKEEISLNPIHIAGVNNAGHNYYS